MVLRVERLEVRADVRLPGGASGLTHSTTALQRTTRSDFFSGTWIASLVLAPGDGDASTRMATPLTERLTIVAGTGRSASKPTFARSATRARGSQRLGSSAGSSTSSPPTARATARRKSLQVRKRSRGSFDRARSKTCDSSSDRAVLNSEGGAGARSSCQSRTRRTLPAASNGWCPVRALYTVIASA